AVVDIPVGPDGKPAGEPQAEVRQVVAGAGAVSYAPVDSLIAVAAARVSARVNRRIATIGASLEREGSQYALGNLVADAQRWAGKGDIAVMNNAGIRSRLPAGTITYGRLFVIQPFDNTLYRVSMTGAQVRQYVEKLVGGDGIGVHVSGITVGYDPTKPKGQRVVSLRLPAGRTLSDDAIYSVVMNNFIATGGSNLGPPDGSHIVRTGVSDLDALIRYLGRQRSPITVPTENRIFITQ
ncbi:MAG: 5'-nucleotidase C-terminal domain-containing protein, partial [Gemmatimonadaceae bacterium]